MSSDFDFFAGQRTPPSAASTWAPPTQQDQRFGSTVDAWQPMSTPTTGQFAPASRSSRRPLALVAWVAVLAVVAAIAGGAFYISTRPHPVPLPATLAGLPKVSLPSAQAHELDSARHGLSSDGVHDVSFGVYGTVSAGQPGLVVVAGRTSSTVPGFNQLASALGQAGQVAGVTVTPQTLTSGASTMQCATISAQGQAVPFCAWQGTHAVLFGFGEQISAQDTADALEQARLRANLS